MPQHTDAWEDADAGCRPALDLQEYRQGETTTKGASTSARAPSRRAKPLLATSTAVQEAPVPCQRPRGPPTLRTLCVQFLSPFAAELAQMPQESLQMLPCDVRAALMAVARRNGELTHSVLMSMLDAYCTSLDLSGCATLKPSTLLAVLPKLPQLAALDLTACRVTNYVLQAIPQCCPHLQVLRLGGDAACDTHRHVWAALIPATDDALDSSCLDDWESLEDAGQASGRLGSLRWLLWPDVPPHIKVLVETQWPKVRLNPECRGNDDETLQLVTAAGVSLDSVPRTADKRVPLDQEWADLVAWRPRWDIVERPIEVEHIAERFLRALQFVDDKKRARFEREWQQAQKHVTCATQFLGISEQQAGSSRIAATRKRSSAQHALEAWFDEC